MCITGVFRYRVNRMNPFDLFRYPFVILPPSYFCIMFFCPFHHFLHQITCTQIFPLYCSPTLRLQHWSLFTFLVSAVIPAYVLTPEDL